MGQPTFHAPIRIHGSAVLMGGAWVVQDGQTVSIEFTPASTGVDDLYLTYRILWGDDTESFMESVPIGRPYQVTHSYVHQGTFTIRVILLNSAGESSDPQGHFNSDSLVILKVLPTMALQRRPVKWSGLALPVDTVSRSTGAVLTAYPALETVLTAPARAGSTQIVVASAPSEVLGANVTIQQPGKFISVGIILSANGNVLTLDAALEADYDAYHASVEVKRHDLPRTASQEYAKPDKWLFPVITDRQLVKASLALLLSTRPFERVMRPELGCKLHELPFEPNDTRSQMLGRRYLLDAASPEARVALQDVIIRKQDAGFQLSVIGELAASPDEIFEEEIPLSQ